MTNQQLANPIHLTSEFAKEVDIPNPRGPRADLPMIQLPGGGYTITESAASLFTLIGPQHKLFIRDTSVMKLGEGENGVPILSLLQADTARSTFEKFAQLVAMTRSGLEPVNCSTSTAKALLASEEAMQLLPKINGLINCPVVYEVDGEVKVAGPGYDAETKRLVTGGKMPEQVDFETARNALPRLLSNFDFRTGSDKSRAMASIIAPGLKLGGFLAYRVPADIAQADQSQSGKTYRQKVIAAIYNEKLSVVANRNGGVGSLDESFSARLLEGHPFIQFDNLRGKIDSQNLEAFFSADGMFPCRTPYRPIVNVNPADYFVFLTSNGLETTRDLANRSAFVSIQKRPSNFQFQKFVEGDLLSHTRAKQPFYLGCVFAIIREWHRRGKQRTDETRHDFKEWAQILDWIVQNLFGLPPLMDGHQDAQQLVSNPGLVFLRQVCIAMSRDELLGEPQTASDIAQVCEGDGIQIPGCRYSDDLEKSSRQIGACLGPLFRAEQVVNVDGYRVERQITPKKRENGEGYIDSKTYLFSRADSALARSSQAAAATKTELPVIIVSSRNNAPQLNMCEVTRQRGGGCKVSFSKRTSPTSAQGDRSNTAEQTSE